MELKEDVAHTKSDVARKPWRAPKVIVSTLADTELGPDNVKTDIDAESAS